MNALFNGYLLTMGIVRTVSAMYIGGGFHGEKVMYMEKLRQAFYCFFGIISIIFGARWIAFDSQPDDWYMYGLLLTLIGVSMALALGFARYIPHNFHRVALLKGFVVSDHDTACLLYKDAIFGALIAFVGGGILATRNFSTVDAMSISIVILVFIIFVEFSMVIVQCPLEFP